jgi:glycerol-3-phosphate dehydrogenase
LRSSGADLEGTTFDLLVIGGGIAGACTAWDAARRGLSVALVESGDFGGGASANSLKTVHGGLRHLQRLELAKVRESYRERAAWLRIAPHLVDPLPVIVPALGHGMRGSVALRAGTALADRMSRSLHADLPVDRRIPPSRWLSRAECLDLAPELDRPGLSGGVLFHDGQTYSSERLTLSVVLGARNAGAVVRNYTEVVAPLRAGNSLVGAAASDRLSGQKIEIRARTIVNAAGADVEDVARLLVPRPSGFPPISVAVNLMFPALGHRVAFALPEPAPATARSGPGRMLFVVPWRGRTMIGTGHFPLTAQGSAQRAPGVDQFTDQVRRAFPTELPAPVGVHWGRLPAASPAGVTPVRLLGRARVVDHAPFGAPAVFSVISVKYTTARRVAEEAVDAVFERLGHSPRASDTATALLPGAPTGSVQELLASARTTAGAWVAPDVLEHLARMYGADYDRPLACRHEVADWDRRVVPGEPVIVAQLVHAVRHEMACTVEDLLDRRTELGARGFSSDEARVVAGHVIARFGAEDVTGRPPTRRP